MNRWGHLTRSVRFDLQEDLRNIFRSLRKTSIMVTHDMGEAGFFGDRVLLLSEGSIVQEGHLQDLIDRPANEYVTSSLTLKEFRKHEFH
jgi:osmoprotectant transport system ATP-binding protein